MDETAVNLGNNFSYQGDTLFCEQVKTYSWFPHVSRSIVNKFNCLQVDLSRLPSRLPKAEEDEDSATPLYVYSRAQIESNIDSYLSAFVGRDHIVGFSLKANPNPEIVRLVHRRGLSVVAVSGFEIRLALDLGFPGGRIFFNGNGKRRWEMRLAAENGCVMNVDSVFNARQLVEVVRGVDPALGDVEVTIRLNVDIETQVHPYLQTGTGLIGKTIFEK